MSRRRSSDQEVLAATGAVRQTAQPAPIGDTAVQAIFWQPPGRRASVEEKGFKHAQGNPKGRGRVHPGVAYYRR